jgi:hypothetical protein
MASKYDCYESQVKEIIENNEFISHYDIVRKILSNPDAAELKVFGKHISRHRKRIMDEYEGSYVSTDSLDVDNTTVKHMWLKSNEISAFVKNPNYIDKEASEGENRIKELHEIFLEAVKSYSFEYPKFERENIEEPHCLVFDAADIHIGKICSSFETGEDYNSQIAVDRVRKGLTGIIQKSKGWKINKVIFIAGNDILHVDNARATTTSGTHQDTDGMWYDNFIMAKKLLVEIIETLLTIADVEVVYNPSNHDFTHGFMLLDSISSWFHKCEQVTFNNNMAHRKYTVYGKNLIGTTHMDSAKVDKLHGLMAEEASEYWHLCKHRYVYGHHVHHTSSKDIFSVCIETLRSPSGTDGWHHRNGYQFSPKAVQGFIHHFEQGQVAKLIHIF